MVGRRSFRFTVVSILYCLLILTLAGKGRRDTVRLLAPLVHCLGCLVGTVFGLYFNRLGINVASGCLLGIISAASVMQSISRLHWEDGAPFVMCFALIGLVCLSLAFKLLYRVLSHYGLLKWFYLGIMFTSMVSSLRSDDPEKLHIAFSFLGNIIGYIIASITYGTMGGNLVGATLGTITGLFTGAMITAIANKDYPFAYFMSTVSVSITLFAAVGWYYFGFLTGTPIFAFMGYTFAFSNVIDQEVVQSGQYEAGNMALYFACRLLGAGISSLTILPLFKPFLDRLVGWLAKKTLKIFSFGFVQSVWQYTANLGARNDTVYGAFMWMKQNHVNLLGSFGLSLTMLIGVASGALLGGLCGHAMLMLTRSSDDERVAGWSLMVSGSVVGALSAYNMSGLKVGVLVGALVGCSITAAILLWRGGFHFKAYFKRNIQLSFGWEIFNMFKSRMERYV